MKRLKSKKGFTMAELLIVVAIIAVLVAISIPIFAAQLEKARESTDLSNMRSIYAECSAAALTETTDGATVGHVTVSVSGNVTTCTGTVVLKQQTANWQSATNPDVGGIKLINTIATGTNVTISVSSDGTISIKQGETNLKN